MATKNAADVAKKWAQNLTGSTQSVQQGVQAVTTAPTALAAAQAQAFVTGVTNAVASGKWQAGLNRVSLQDWQNAMIQKGIPRIGPGATAAQGKFASFMSQLLPFQQSLSQQLAQMPRGDINANIQRMVFWATQMHQNFKRQS
ncbi:MAG TPA: hypothetical protein VFH56_16325 [Acidimicrobiales bacterium]|nr:hypothetical protein [Acidimicrobiales bacterium]